MGVPVDDAPSSARLLAFRFMCLTDCRADDVYRLCRRLLGHRETCRETRAPWSDAFDLLVILISDSETFAASVRRYVADRRDFGQDRERTWA